ncbi:MAG TPA: hypothetical protein VGM37_02515 [Armatimonadota bacterium]|jgi:hypothetical protein
MTRKQALAWLMKEFAEPLADSDLGWTFTDADPEGRLAGVIDNALRGLGVNEDALATAEVIQEDVPDFLTLLAYHALQAFTRAFALWVDVEVDDPKTAKNYSQRYRAYKALLDQARKEAETVLASAFETGALTLDIYEPSPTY